MESGDPVDMDTMLEALKIADDLELSAARLKGLESNTCTNERASLEVQERLHVEQYAQIKGRPVNPTPVLLDVEITRDEVGYCHAKLIKLWRRLAGVEDPAGQDPADGSRENLNERS